MIIKGLDNGYLYTKDNEKRIFKSAYSRTDRTLSDKSKIIINGETLYFGYGNNTTDVDKTDNKLTETCTLANVALTGYNEEYYLVVGLPIEQYKEKKDKFKKTVMNYNTSEVVYDNITFRPKIKDVEVFVQGVGSLFNIGLPDGEYISFDIGSYTINIALVEIKKGIPYILKYNTMYSGVLTLYSQIISEVNKKFDITLDVEYAEKILSNGLTVNAEKQDVGFLKTTMNDYLYNVLSKFKSNFPYAVAPIILCGGGANLLIKVFEKYFKNHMLLPDSQFANAIGYYNIGRQKFGHLVNGGSRYVQVQKN